MPYQRSKHRRRSIRLKGFDYAAPGAYFVTINVHKKAHLMGRVVNGKMRLSTYGQVAWDCWQAIPDHFPHVELDAFVVMPTHMHGIIVIVDEVDTPVADDAADEDDVGPPVAVPSSDGAAEGDAEVMPVDRLGPVSQRDMSDDPLEVTDGLVGASGGPAAADLPAGTDGAADMSVETVAEPPGMIDRAAGVLVRATHASPLPYSVECDESPVASLPSTDVRGEPPSSPRPMTDTCDTAPSPPVVLTGKPAPSDGDACVTRPVDQPPAPRPRGPQSGSLGAIIGSYKSASTARINQIRGTPGGRVWQRNYYERIVRNDAALRRIRRYIQTNPARWRKKRR
jgi:REP element-mobilizing transposase RayT